ncbi:MAG TPA: hypothetical protein VI387_02065, partial [Candidatus Brocadiales bacterium]|nr:hypothetical protein [Candidatus Brocadiales bacterium]
MSFKKILCQDNIIQLFQGIIAKKRIAHAYIFTGPDGVGKALFAKELVKALFCEFRQGESVHPSKADGRPPLEGASGVTGGLDACPIPKWYGACDNCRACRRVESGNHPDVHWIAREKDDKDIKIEYIHVLQDDVSLKPVEADRKVFIISEADRMNEESSNCLLKTLEEPPPNTIIILITTSVKSLKKTITSRCQVVRFNPLPSSTIETESATKFDTNPEVLKWVSQSSCGSLGRATKFLEKGIYERENYIIERLSSLKLGDNFSFSEEIIKWDSYQGEPSEEKRSRLRLILDIFLQFYRDALLCKTCPELVSGTGIKDILLYNPHRKGVLESLCANLSKRSIINIIEHIVTSMEYMAYNVNVNLLLENLLAKIALAQAPNLKDN